MVRIEGKDADAIGEQARPRPPPKSSRDKTAATSMVWDQLRTCYDPEIPVNIVDLGLVYALRGGAAAEEAASKVAVRFTLTAPGCGMGDLLQAGHQAQGCWPCPASRKRTCRWCSSRPGTRAGCRTRRGCSSG